MQVISLYLKEVLLNIPQHHGDHRGFFSESWNKRRMKEHGIEIDFVQDNHSLSAQVGTVRGLHFQAPPHAQDKLVRCGLGRLFDVAVDVRKGFLHGFMTLEPDTEIIYKCSDYYAPECDGAVRWDSCGIDWPLEGIEPVQSEKDKIAPTLAEFDSPFVYEGTV